MRPLLLGLPLVAGCGTTVGPDRFCKEVGYAIAGRTQECTGDAALAEARYADFEAAYTCVEVDAGDTATASGVKPEDLFACPLAIRNLACELVESYGDDLDAWLATSPACALLVEQP